MALSKRQIIKQLITYYQFKTRQDFADFLGIQLYTLNNWHNRDTFDIQLMLKKFPDVNARWIVQGEGEMFDNVEKKEVDFGKMTIKERLSYYLERKGINIFTMEKECGLSNGSFKKKSEMRQENIEKVLRAYADLSRNWLMFGEGEMLVAASGDSANPDCMPVAKEPEVKFVVNDNRNKENHVIGCSGKIIKIDLDTLKNITLEEYCLGNQLDDFSTNLLPEFTFMYQLQSRELEPYMVQGDWVCVRKVELEEVRFDKAYLVDTYKYGKMIKRIEKVDDGSLILKLPVRSVKYPVITLEQNEINGYYEVVSRIQNYNNVIFFESRGVDKILKQNDEFLKFANAALESNNQMLAALQNSLNIVQDAIKVIKKQHNIEG